MSAQTPLGGPGRPVGANTVLFSPLPVADAFAHLARCGYDGVELAAIRGMCEHLELGRWQDQAAQIKDLSDQHGLGLLSMEETRLDPEQLEPGLAAAEALGIPFVNVGPGGKSDEPGALETTIDKLKVGAKMAADHGVTLCVKAHVGAAMYNTQTTLAVLDAIDDPAFGIDYDPSHIMRAGEDPAEALRAIVGRARHIHIRDCPAGVKGPGPIAEQACGRGVIDLRAVCDVIVESDYQGPVVLEVIGAKPDNPVTDLVAVAAETRGYLAAAFAGARAS